MAVSWPSSQARFARVHSHLGTTRGLQKRKESILARLSDKVAIVTGAGMGIGEAIARLFAEEGASVVVVDVDEQAGGETVAGITAEGGRATFIACDVGKAEQVRCMVDSAFQAYGRIDMLVNNAGIVRDGTVVDLSEEDWDKMFDVNLKGIFLCSKYAIPHIAARGGGAIVNIASTSGLAAQTGLAGYNASKGGAVLLTKNMALDFAAEGIRVNCICPAGMITPMFEAGIARYDDPEAALARRKRIAALGVLADPVETAKVALFLANDESSYITGTVLIVDGGVMAQFAGQIRRGV
jgi:NAD(P)-dependent dehydrogenase (short-subunit alcohol dehydrogenase family)